MLVLFNYFITSCINWLCKAVFSDRMIINKYVIVLMVINMGQIRCNWYQHQCWISWTVTKQNQIMEMQSKWIKGWLKEKRLIKVRIQFICRVDHCFEIFIVSSTNLRKWILSIAIAKNNSMATSHLQTYSCISFYISLFLFVFDSNTNY